MSWQSAKQIALQYLRRLNLPEDLTGIQIKLADYPDQETKDFLKPGDRAWTLEFHRMVNNAFARELRKRGGTVQFITIQLPEFYDWLVKENLDNTPAYRAAFVSFKTK